MSEVVVSRVLILATGGNDCAGCCGDNGNGDYKDEQRTSIFVALKAFGFILILLSIFEFGVAGAASNIALHGTGAFCFAGILSIIAGSLAVFSRNRGVVIAAIVIGSFAILLASIGTSFDGIFKNAALRLKACSNQSYSGVQTDYGSRDCYSNSRRCLAEAGKSVVPDMCYCTSSIEVFFF
jgi:hypothetical protein